MVGDITSKSIGLSVGPLPPKAAATGHGQEKSFMQELQDVYAKYTGKLVGTDIPAVGVVYSTNPEKLLPFNSQSSIV